MTTPAHPCCQDEGFIGMAGKKDMVPDSCRAVINSCLAVAALSWSDSHYVDIFQNPLGVTEETAQSSFEPAGLLRSSALAACCGNTVSSP